MDKKFIIKSTILLTITVINIYSTACLNLPPSYPSNNYPTVTSSPTLTKYEVKMDDFISKLNCIENDLNTSDINKQKIKSLKNQVNNLEKSPNTGYIFISTDLYRDIVNMPTKDCNFSSIVKK
ncbi:MAG: hypothetical protein U0354_10820 [Candidatus Sericytochromatia bacterium]